ncbi:S-adenosyl-L-methionine-dependent methyltransferase [Cokeromyces recurvatus]|uniref:S-adenosyl-L-methionine-dependent methyltransferase n=1 Tax=Cokeromyces recurvatus TaxID=90255 RepID=UPI00222032C7|nr:S-adenosyl-L-methionine-dependent methyltransferase [Cokeromyces recurvatus]KAI7907829.1 S-adenosyl-L-methionine-dependent methyltransferase [Cokeromyces recurvatus]
MYHLLSRYSIKRKRIFVNHNHPPPSFCFFFSFLFTIKSRSAKLSSSVELNNDFVHRVKITNLPTHELGAIKIFFQSFGIHKYKKAPKWDYAYLNFETEEAARSAVFKLHGAEFKKRNLSAEYSKVPEKSSSSTLLLHPSKEQQQRGLSEIEKDDRPIAERLADQVTPLHKIAYEDQIAKKHKLGARYLNKLRKKLNSLPDISDVGKQQIAWTKTLEDMQCEVFDIIHSPSIDEYRTKCEFSIGKNLEGNETVGFVLGLYKDGITTVSSPNECLHVSKKAKEIAKMMEEYVRQSEYEVYDRVKKRGVWRTMMTRTQRTGDVMVLIQINAESLTEEQLVQEKKNLINYWSHFFSKGEENTKNTLMLQIWNGNSNGITDKGKTEILTGDGYVYEELLGHRFQISYNSFFQVNTPVTELLYAKCAEWCYQPNKEKKTTLLDLCCGTGTIGITMAKSVDQVIGIEMVPEAIVDAKANALMNNVSNIQFYTGKVEDRLDIVTNKEKHEEVIAILDPPRSGVHSSVIRAIRETLAIQKVIFISCDAKQAMQNFIGLCRPTSKKYQGSPFKPSKAVSVDLFPHTEHCELMIEFIRT